MGVRTGDPPNPPAGAREDRGDMRIDGRARVDDDQIVPADQIRVRAGTGHHARIRRDDARDERIELLGNAGQQVIRRLRAFAWIAPMDFRISGIVAANSSSVMSSRAGTNQLAW